MNESLKLTLEEGNLDDVLTVIFFHVDELYNQISHLVARSGSKPIFSDSEVITLILVNQMVIDSETACRADFYGLNKGRRIIFVIFFFPLDHCIDPMDKFVP